MFYDHEILKKQNVTDGRMEAQTDNVNTVYPPTNTVCGGVNIEIKITLEFLYGRKFSYAL